MPAVDPSEGTFVVVELGKVGERTCGECRLLQACPFAEDITPTTERAVGCLNSQRKLSSMVNLASVVAARARARLSGEPAAVIIGLDLDLVVATQDFMECLSL